jgi:FemAB-related protein (PEP-CTERM system-associated)
MRASPFCVYGGPLAADAESAAALVTHAEALGARIGVSAVEFRHRDAIASVSAGRDANGGDAPESDWIERPNLYVTFRKAIEADREHNMKAIPRKQRAMVRKGTQNGLKSVVGRDIDGLHKVYAESVRNLGTPVFSRRYFRLLMDAFGDAADVATILQGDRPVAAVMNFYFRGEVLPYYGGGTIAAKTCAGNDFMYWEVMRRAADRGLRLFDFGRSKIGTGAYAFKHNWGFVPEKLHYRYRLAPGAAIPGHNPMNPKYRLFIAAWKRMPLPMANVLGPFIVRGLG